MGIGSVTSTNSVSNIQMMKAASTDPKIKNIQNKITDAEQKMQKISSKEELSANEKTSEREKLQKEISSLNTELKRQQEELSRSQKRERMMAKLQEDMNSAKEEEAEDKADTVGDREEQTKRQGSVITQNSDGTVILKEVLNQDEKQALNQNAGQVTNQSAGIGAAYEENVKGMDDKDKDIEEDDKEKALFQEDEKAIDDAEANTGISGKEMNAMVSADISMQHANNQGRVITRTHDGIAILRSEINQDKKRDVNTEQKQAELKKMEKQELRASKFQSSILDEADNAMQSAMAADAAAGKGAAQVNTDNNAFISALKASQENGQIAEQRFYVSFA